MHPSDDKTSELILNSYEKKRWSILVAQMQSGKTGTYISLATKMKDKDMIDSAIVISSYNSVALREQTRSRFKEYIPNVRVWFLPELIRLTRRKIQIDINLVNIMRRCLLIIDESHIGTKTDSVIDKLLRMIGVSGNGYIDPILYPNNDLYILSVSATPYAEIASMKQNGYDQSYKEIIYHEPGDGYKGITDFNLYQIDSDRKEDQLYEILEKYKDTKTYGIIRQGKTFKDKSKNPYKYIWDTVESFCKENNVKYIFCDQNGYTTKILSYEPKEYTIVLIKEYCKAGQTICKDYISFVYEIYKKTDAQAQGLPGRCCGYDNAQIDIYCNKEILQDHINWISNIHLDPYNIPSLGYNVTPIRKEAKIKSLYLYRNTLSIESQIKVFPIPDSLLSNTEKMIELCKNEIYKNNSIHFILQSEYDNETYHDAENELLINTVENGKWLASTTIDALIPLCEEKNNEVQIIYTTQQELILFLVEKICPDYKSRATASYISSQDLVKKVWKYKTPIGACLSKFRDNYNVYKKSGINTYWF